MNAYVQKSEQTMTEKELRSAINSALDSYFSTPAQKSHFSAAELMCPCCGVGADKMSPNMLRMAEEIRHENGDKPMNVSSGYRCKKHNAEVGGNVNSHHLYGQAMDVHINGVPASTIVAQAKRRGSPDAYAMNADWAHISVSK